MVYATLPPGTLENRIIAHYESLPPSERRLADVILDFPGEIASYQAAELAAKAGVSKAAATRLFKRLGYEDYNAVRIEARKARSVGSPVHLNRLPVSNSDFGRALSAHLDNDIENLTASLANINPRNLKRIVEILKHSQWVYIIGYRNSYVLGSYLQSELGRIRPNVMMLPRPGQTLAEDLVNVSRKDIVVMIALRRRVSVTVPVVDFAQTIGARVLLITDTKHKSISGKATWVLRARIDGTSLFDSYVGIMSVMNFICTAVGQQLNEPGRTRLKQIDAIHDRLNELSTK